MSSAYGPLAAWYDKLTLDVPYDGFLDFYEREFAKNGGEFHTVLDFCCGTGTLTWRMAQRGYEMIASDASPDMLMQASAKALDVAVAPLFLCQEASELDLYGTVDAAICSLDGMDYIPPEELNEVFRRLHLFIRPGGLFIFDIRSPEWFRSIDGDVFVDETDDVLCLWRADFDDDEGCMCYGMDIFSKTGKLWRRESEEHIEFAHEPKMLEQLLDANGFINISFRSDCPQGDDGRIFVVAENTAH